MMNEYSLAKVQKYYIKSDYVYYDENIIKWKGNIYVKRKK